MQEVNCCCVKGFGVRGYVQVDFVVCTMGVCYFLLATVFHAFCVKVIGVLYMSVCDTIMETLLGGRPRSCNWLGPLCASCVDASASLEVHGRVWGGCEVGESLCCSHCAFFAA